MPKRVTAFFTGNYWIDTHYRRQIEGLIDLALEQNTRQFLCGMTLGFDQVVADILIARRLPWTAVLPHPNIVRLDLIALGKLASAPDSANNWRKQGKP